MCKFTKRNICTYACVYIYMYTCICTCIFALYLYIYIDMFMYSIPMEALLWSCVVCPCPCPCPCPCSCPYLYPCLLSLSAFACMSWMSWHSPKEKEIHQKDGNRTERSKTSHDARRSHSRMSHVTHTNEAYVTRIWLSRATYLNHSCHPYGWVILHECIRSVTQMNESCHTCESVVSYI